MKRVRMLPKKLYHGERIEAREFAKDGFFARVDLFESPEDVLKFIPKPCDVYRINPFKLVRKQLFVTDHPEAKIYNYYENIPKEHVYERMTYR